MSQKHVVIVGGGLAGMAAAVALAPRGFRVTLLESRPRLGGRASSFTDPTTGNTIDNCQHVSLGCCTNWQHFCNTTGLADALRWEPELWFIGPDGKANEFAASGLPAPLHLLPSFMRLSYLNRQDKRALSRGLRTLVNSRTEFDRRQSFRDWLQQQKQTPAAIERFWHVVLVSALSETLDRIDIGHARKVFVDAFCAHRNGWRMQLPTVSLDELYTRRVRGWLANQGTRIELQQGVRSVSMAGESGRGVVLRSGEELPADHVVLAVPHHLVKSLLPDDLQRRLALPDIDRLEAAPISSVHLWFDRPITHLPHAVLVERLSQWLFNRARIQEGGGKGAHYYQVVISAARNLQGRSQEEVIAEVVAELGAIFPAARAARLDHARLVTEHKAVFSVLPGVDAFRPPQRTKLPHLHLAGDWTRTGWPATMEGAIRSGFLAAESVLQTEGRPEPLVQPDLPMPLLGRLLLGLKG